MVSAATRRKKRERENRVAKHIEDGRRLAAAEEKIIGTKLGPKVPNAVLFQVDRKGLGDSDGTKTSVFKSRQERLDAKRAARAKPRPRKSELAAEAPNGMDVDTEIARPAHGKKKKREAGLVDDQILRKHFLNKENAESRKADEKLGKASGIDEYGDVWESELVEQVQSQITDRRRYLIKKVSRRLRRAPAVLFPDAGVSVNPSYGHHQDKLGEAVAAIVSEKDRMKWDEKLLSYDPAILTEGREGEFGDTGMKTDVGVTTGQEENEKSAVASTEDESTHTLNNSVPERKTRRERNKEKRKREMESNIRKKRRESRQALDISQLETIVDEAREEADKINGVTKRKLRRQHVRVPLRPNRPVRKRIAGRRVRTEASSEPVALSEELSENFRSVQLPITNPVIQERFLSFERRGMVEPPKVVATDLWRMEQEKRRLENKDPRKRKGKHSTSNISYWKEKSRK